uniref:Rx N-terminal domain-containing protein n=1 Tax=Leersia perrieri TaxID=77586 RepID=A0A0D9Y0G3_9ORYZ
MEAVVCASHGTIGSLLWKLSALLSDEYNILAGVKRDIMFLKAELESMDAFLKKMSAVEDPDEQSKYWIKEVRELSYDIEDIIDTSMFSLGYESNRKPCGFKRFAGRCMDFFTNVKTRHWIAKKIQCLKCCVIEASNRRARYKVDGSTSNLSRRNIDPRLPAFYKEMTALVGTDGPRDKLIEMLLEGEGALVNQLKVVSIIGFGGLGKTTLANEVCQKLEGQFKYQAFVLVSQKPDIKEILRHTLSDLLTCLLYLSIFPEDYEIKRDRLIRRWIAEGFIPTEGVHDMEEIQSYHTFSLDLLLDSWFPPPRLLQKFEMFINYYFPRIPKWIESLDYLTYLDINIDPVDEETFQTLADLPSLIFLWISSRAATPKERLIISRNGFQCLKELYFTCWESKTRLMFEAGAMPKLEKLRVPFNAYDVCSLHGVMDFGIQHLCSLKHLHVEIVCHQAKIQEVEALENAVKSAAELLSDELTFELSMWDEKEIIDMDHEPTEDDFGTIT